MNELLFEICLCGCQVLKHDDRMKIGERKVTKIQPVKNTIFQEAYKRKSEKSVETMVS